MKPVDPQARLASLQQALAQHGTALHELAPQKTAFIPFRAPHTLEEAAFTPSLSLEEDTLNTHKEDDTLLLDERPKALRDLAARAHAKVDKQTGSLTDTMDDVAPLEGSESDAQDTFLQASKHGASRRQTPSLATQGPAQQWQDSPLASPSLEWHSMPLHPDRYPMIPSGAFEAFHGADDFGVFIQGIKLPHIPVASSPDDSQDGADLVVREHVGEGGIGLVHRAFQRSLCRDVAIKRVKEGADVQHPEQMLLHEGILTGYLEHPNIIPTHALGYDSEGRPLLVMKYVEGIPWSTLLAEDNHPYWEKLKLWSDDPFVRHLEILIELCKALSFAHSRGIIHRDIKPDNVMLGEFGEVYLLDWGIAKRYRLDDADENAENLPEQEPQELQGFFGTPAYMAPEMLDEAQALDPRTDVFLLGATLHEVLTGQPPHQGSSIEAMILSIFECRAPQYDKHLPAELTGICRRAMAPSPTRRYPSVRHFRDALIAYMHHRSSTKLSDTAHERLVTLRDFQKALPAASSKESQQLHRVFNECRFGFLEALRLWEDNASAQQGLEESIQRMFEVELQQRNFDAAAALLDEMREPAEERKQQLHTLQSQLQREQEEQKQLQALQREQDFSISQKQRLRLMLSMSGVAVFFASIRFYLGPAQDMGSGYQRSIFFAGFTTALFLIGLVAGRMALFENRVNRHFATNLILCCAVVTVHRVVQAFQSAPLEQTFTVDMIMLGCITASTALILRRWMAWASAGFFAGAGLSKLYPAYTYHIMTLCMAHGWLICSFFWSREQYSQPKEEDEALQATPS